MNLGSQPIVRVALEPANPGDLDKLIAGMRMLEQSDPCAEYHVMESGEHVITTAGELHLERCLKDLRERFARCEIQVSEPIIPYRETIVSGAEMAPPRNKELPRGTVVGVSTSKQITLRLRVRPLPAAITEFLVKHASAIRRICISGHHAMDEGYQSGVENSGNIDSDGAGVEGGDRDALSLADFKNEFDEILKKCETDPELWANVPSRIMAFGPRRVGPNLLVDATRSGCCQDMSVMRRPDPLTIPANESIAFNQPRARESTAASTIGLPTTCLPPISPTRSLTPFSWPQLKVRSAMSPYKALLFFSRR